MRSAAARRRPVAAPQPALRAGADSKETGRRHEPPGRRVPNEEGCDREVEFIGDVPGEELGVHRLAALDHQPAHAAAVEILAHPLQVHRLAAVDTVARDRAAPTPRSRLWPSAIDHLLGVAGREEAGRGIQPTPVSDGDLDR